MFVYLLISLQGWIKLLRQMVLKLPEVLNLRSLMALCSEDAEVDFFNNIIDPKVSFCIKLRCILHGWCS